MWPYYFMDYHWWDMTAEKVVPYFLVHCQRSIGSAQGDHFGWKDICCQVDLLLSDTFVLARGHFVTARLQSLLPKYNYWKVFNCNWKSNCSDRLLDGTVPLAVCNNNLIAKYSNRWNFYPPLLVCCWSTILQPAPHWSGNFTAKLRIFAALCDGGFGWMADSELLMSIPRKEESQPHIALLPCVASSSRNVNIVWASNFEELCKFSTHICLAFGGNGWLLPLPRW